MSTEKEYEIALVDLETYYSFPNISNHNNVIEYVLINTQEDKQIVIRKGSYGIMELIKELKRQLKTNGDEDAFELSASPNIFQSRLELKPGYKVKFTHKNSLKTVLGFPEDVYNEGTHDSEKLVNIMSITSILIHIDIINGSHVEE